MARLARGHFNEITAGCWAQPINRGDGRLGSGILADERRALREALEHFVAEPLPSEPQRWVPLPFDDYEAYVD